jgi:hypothetical protein
MICVQKELMMMITRKKESIKRVEKKPKEMRNKEVIMISVQKELMMMTKREATLVGVYKQLMKMRNKRSDENG